MYVRAINFITSIHRFVRHLYGLLLTRNATFKHFKVNLAVALSSIKLSSTIGIAFKSTQWLFVLEQYAEFGLLFVLQWEYFLQLSVKYSFFSISITLL